MKIKGIHHVAIIVSDYSRSRHFYVDILGLRVVAENYRSERQSFKLDLQVDENTRIELFSFPSPPLRPTKPEACGLRHLSFRVSDIEGAASYLREKSVETEPIRLDPYTGKRFTFFPDPDGLPLELYEA